MPKELRDLLARLGELTDAELTELHQKLREYGVGLADTDPADLTDAIEAEAEEVASAIEKVEAEASKRETDREARKERMAAIKGRIAGADDDEQTASDEDGDDDESDADDGEAEPDADDTSETEDEGSEGGATDDDKAEPIAASGAGDPAPPARRMPTMLRVRSRAPDLRDPRVRQTASHRSTGPDAPAVALVAAANVPGITAGDALDTPEKLAMAFESAISVSEGFVAGRVKVPIAKLKVEFPDERWLGDSPSANADKLKAVTSPAALAASGGICAPSPVRYDVPFIEGTDARPVRDELTARFGADRGGIVTMPPPLIEDLASGVDIWTNAIDLSPGGDTKGYVTVTCPSERETVIDAITRRMRYGNFRAKYWMEQIDAWLSLLMVNHARIAERRWLTKIGSNTYSKQVTSGQLLGTTRDVLTTLDRANAVWRNRHRAPNMTLRWGLPVWLIDQMRADLTREMPGSAQERLATADAYIENFFRVRKVNPTWLLEGETGQDFTAQPASAALQGWPSTVVSYMFPEGTWLFLDGGSLDLGIIRDSTLVGTNDVEVFAETMENVHFYGAESWRLTMDVCPEGTASSLTDISPCTTGS